MPVISYFFGIYIRMYHDDHPPMHIHVEYQEELKKDWELAQRFEPLEKIPGVDSD